MPGEHYFRAKYLNQAEITSTLNRHPLSNLARSCKELDAQARFLDVINLENGLIRFLTELAAIQHKQNKTTTTLEQYEFNFYCYASIDEHLFRIALKIVFTVSPDLVVKCKDQMLPDYSNYQIFGDMRLIPNCISPEVDLEQMCIYLNSNNNLMLQDWSVLLFSRINIGAVAVQYCNITDRKSEIELYFLEMFHGFIISLLEPMAIYIGDYDFSAGIRDFYGYKPRDIGFTDNHETREQIEMQRLSIDRNIYYSFCLPPNTIAQLKNQFIHCIAGEPAVLIDKVPETSRCRIS